MWQWIGLMLVALLLPAAPAAAQDRLDAAVAALDRATAQPKAEAAAVERMAGLLRMAPETVRVQHASTRLGWGDFFMAQRIATRGGHPVEKVFAARRSGAAWDEIAAEARVDADLLVQDVAAVWPGTSAGWHAAWRRRSSASSTCILERPNPSSSTRSSNWSRKCFRSSSYCFLCGPSSSQ